MHDRPRTPDERSLRDVAGWLTTPAACGVFLSAFDLKRLGQSIGIGVTPLNRRFAVEQLFRSAAVDESADALFEALVEEVTAHRARYEECGSVHLRPWIDLCGDTINTLLTMREDWRQSHST